MSDTSPPSDSLPGLGNTDEVVPPTLSQTEANHDEELDTSVQPAVTAAPTHEIVPEPIPASDANQDAVSPTPAPHDSEPNAEGPWTHEFPHFGHTHQGIPGLEDAEPTPEPSSHVLEQQESHDNPVPTDTYDEPLEPTSVAVESSTPNNARNAQPTPAGVLPGFDVVFVGVSPVAEESDLLKLCEAFGGASSVRHPHICRRRPTST
jgi:hypothetical protein